MKQVIEQILGIEYPILLGGMKGVGDIKLAAAVSEGGGLGTLPGSAHTAESISQQIKGLREKTDKPFAVNIPLREKAANDVINAVIKEKVSVVITGAGDPAEYTRKLKDAGITVIHVVPTVKMALEAEMAGVNAVIAEGFDSGGFTSKYEIGTLSLIPQVVDAVQIPVIAAGGICDSRGYLAARILGASAVSLGTAFLASEECSKSYQSILFKSLAENTTVMGRGTAFAIRAIKNDFYYMAEGKLSEGASPYEMLNMIASANNKDPEKGFICCGQGVGLLKEMKSAAQIIKDIIDGTNRELSQICR